MQSIKNIKNLSGKRVLIRVDFNVPMKNGKIVDDFRIKKSLPTIKYLIDKKAIVILISHLGDDTGESLKVLLPILEKYLPKVKFITTPILGEQTTDELSKLKKGEVVLLENLRFNEGEKKNSPSFARALSRYADIYVNEAFSVSHRSHASVVGIPKFLPSYAGLNMIEEIKNLEKAFDPQHPFIFILGGAKFETKIPLIKKFINRADNVFIGGALANDFFRTKGYQVGVSLVGENNFEIGTFLKKKNLILPSDVLVENDKGSHLTRPNQVSLDESIVDLGPETLKVLEKIINESKFILLNGPLGKYKSGFDKGTKELLKIITRSKAHSIIGGGDTVSIISKLNLEKKFDFVSTGGGATLDFLSTGSLPGIKALK